MLSPAGQALGGDFMLSRLGEILRVKSLPEDNRIPSVLAGGGLSKEYLQCASSPGGGAASKALITLK